MECLDEEGRLRRGHEVGRPVPARGRDTVVVDGELAVPVDVRELFAPVAAPEAVTDDWHAHESGREERELLRVKTKLQLYENTIDVSTIFLYLVVIFVTGVNQ